MFALFTIVFLGLAAASSSDAMPIAVQTDPLNAGPAAASVE